MVKKRHPIIQQSTVLYTQLLARINKHVNRYTYVATKHKRATKHMVHTSTYNIQICGVYISSLLLLGVPQYSLKIEWIFTLFVTDVTPWV